MKFLSSILFIITLSITLQANMEEAKAALANENYKKAYSIFSVHANDGDKFAQLRMGLLYYNGNGVKKDKNKSFYWLSQALLQDSPEALKVLKKYFPNKYSLYYKVPKNARIQMLDIKHKLKSEEYIKWYYKNNVNLAEEDLTYFNSKIWFIPKKKLNHSSAINYCKKLKINSFEDFQLASFNNLQNYHYNVHKVSFYWSSSQMNDWGKSYINQYGNALSSYAKNRRSFLCVRNAGYKDSAFFLATILYNEYVKKINKLNIIPNKPTPKDIPKLLKGEFETTQEFNDRKEKIKEKIKEKNQQALASWKKYVTSEKELHMKKLSKVKTNKQNPYLYHQMRIL
ncbi:MAG: hypothetical protein L3J08_09625 [Flavobacteriaceae bacterium]|nr:hypothetical protein [Flavobacteriaceae bacterium]